MRSVLDETTRLRRLAGYYLAEGEARERLTSTLALVSHSLDFPVVSISVLDDRVQYTIADHHMPDNSPMARADSICQYVQDAGVPISIPDLQRDPRTAQLPGVVAGVVRTYLGVPLHSRERQSIGSLCVMDPNKRRLTRRQVERLCQFADIIEDQLEVIRRSRERRYESETTPDALSRAVRNDEIVPWYQPVVDLSTGEIAAYEALARWQRPDGSIEDPGRFVPLAEDSDLVLDVDRVIMSRSLADLADWRLARPGLRLNVNLSPRHLEVADGVDAIREIVAASGVPTDAVDLELTETRDLIDVDEARRGVRRLRRAGFRVLLDDFGNGWSSLEWVLRLEVDGLKIDRAITAAAGRPVGDAIIRAVIGFSTDLGIDTVIEGIATRKQARLATEAGFDFGQGYHWSMPVPAAKVGESLPSGQRHIGLVRAESA